jgi:diphthine synthase
MLTFIGLGLWDEKDVSFKGREEVKKADEVYVEFYTSKLIGTDLQKMEQFFGRKLKVLERSDLEERSREIIAKAKERNIAVLVPGDPMVATTHAAIRVEAKKSGIRTLVIHAASIMSAVCGLTGLHNYRFGKSATVSRYGNTISKTPIDVIKQNWSIDAHTLLYLDLEPEPMVIGKAVEILLNADDEGILKNCFAVGIARAGSSKPFVRCDRLEKLKEIEFGKPLHIVVVLAKTLHFMEYEYLKYFASAPQELKELVI